MTASQPSGRDRSGLDDDEMVGGRFTPRESPFRRWISRDTTGDLPAQVGRYHLYAARACPFSHRALLAHSLKGLDEIVDISFVDPFRDTRGWRFSGGRYVDHANGFELLSEAYDRTDSDYISRASVPVLWDTQTEAIISNDSADIMRMFGSVFDDLGARPLDLYPQPLHDVIDRLNERINDGVNNGVYRVGFATDQAAYEKAFDCLFATMDWLDDLLSRGRYLTGSKPTEADWRLLPSLVRFDAVYHTLFRCNGRRLVDYLNLPGYTRDLYQHPGIAKTVTIAEIKTHYYGTLGMLNPSGIIPRGPLDADFSAPHGRT
jgi:putative glutathione S-transferase